MDARSEPTPPPFPAWIRWPAYAVVAAFIAFVLIATALLPPDRSKREMTAFVYEKATAEGRDPKAVAEALEACDWRPLGAEGWEGWAREADTVEFETCLREYGLMPR
jgi:hypothetical protein